MTNSNRVKKRKMPDKSKKSANPKNNLLRQRSPKINELLYQTLIDNLHLGITLIDTNYRIVTTNVGQDKLFKKSKSELIGKHCFREFEKRSQICPHCPGTRSMATGRPAEAYAEGTRDDGSHIQAHLRTFPVFESDGSISGFIEIVENITEYKRTEKSLKESEERFKAIFDNAADGILLADSESKKLYMANKVFCQMLGYRLEEIKKLKVSDIHPRKQLTYIVKQFEKQTRKEITLALDIPLQRKDGSVFYADVNAFPVTLDGKTYLMGIFRDITERRLAEEKLKESEQRFRAIINNAPDGILLAEVESKKFYMGNKVMCHMLGYKPEEIKNLTVADIHPKEHLSYIMQDFERQARRETALSGDIPVKRKNGGVFYVDINTFTITFGDKTYLAGIFRDITERKKTTDELRKTRARLEYILATTPATTYTCKVGGNWAATFVSENIKEQFGYEPQQFLKGGFWAAHIHPDDRRRVLDRLSVLLENNFHAHEYRFLHKDGSYRWVLDQVRLIRDEGGKPAECIGFWTDITKRKNIEDELNTYREKMTQAERLASLGTLSATVAHEMTQPLTVIRLSIENSLEGLEPTSCCPAVKDALKDALNEVVNATSVVDRFRNYARQSTRKPLCETNLGTVASRIIQLLSKTAQRAKMTLHLKGMDKLPPVHSNEKDLEQLFFALTENAIHAADGKESRRLTIEGVAKGKNVELRFRDNCSGIAPENLDKIFDPFFTTSSDGGGTGLGLAIVRQIVSGYGGKIRVRSLPGKGTTFYVTLPIHSEIVE